MSIIIQTCPECGADLEHAVFPTDPPIKVWRCPKCGWEHRYRETIKRVPFEPPKEEWISADLDTIIDCYSDPAEEGE